MDSHCVLDVTCSQNTFSFKPSVKCRFSAVINDSRNRPAEIEMIDGGIQKNRYDGEGLREELEENGELTRFLYSGRDVVTEQDEKNNTIRYVRGLQLLSSDCECARTYYHYASDELGSITHVTDESGTVLNRYSYDAFGNQTVKEETVQNRFGFTGEICDGLTGQYYLRARFYNPVIGRFLNEDTYYGDGLNLYSYCRNNPVRYVDPSGHWCEGKEGRRALEGGSGTLGGDKYFRADNIVDGARLKEYYKQAEKYGTGAIKELENGRYRFYEEIKPSKTAGEMAGARHVREWNPFTGQKRDWYETLDHAGNIRQVRPDPNITGGVKVHYMFDKDGNYTDSWSPK